MYAKQNLSPSLASVFLCDPLCAGGLEVPAYTLALKTCAALAPGTLANVLLQKQAGPTAALLSPWLSGYAFLFNMETILERAKEPCNSLPGNMGGGTLSPRLRVGSPAPWREWHLADVWLDLLEPAPASVASPGAKP